MPVTISGTTGVQGNLQGNVTGNLTGVASELAPGGINNRTLITDLSSNDAFLFWDSTDQTLKKVEFSKLQTPGSVLQTYYNEIIDQVEFTGNTIPTTLTSPTTATGHELFSRTVAVSDINNYIILQANAQLCTSGGGQTLLMAFANNTLIAARSLDANFGAPTFIIRHTPGNTNSIRYSVRAAGRDGYGDLQVNRMYTIPTMFRTGREVTSMLLQEIKG